MINFTCYFFFFLNFEFNSGKQAGRFIFYVNLCSIEYFSLLTIIHILLDMFPLVGFLSLLLGLRGEWKESCSLNPGQSGELFPKSNALLACT